MSALKLSVSRDMVRSEVVGRNVEMNCENGTSHWKFIQTSPMMRSLSPITGIVTDLRVCPSLLLK